MSPRLAWYGDDFTGAAAVAEVLSLAGISAALFLRIPTDAERARLGPLDAVGLAGTARAEAPGWLDAHLPGILGWMWGLDADLIHYKICSTLDSAPGIGSIGRALEILVREVGADWVPILPASPEFGRYQAFGTLFAAGEGGIARLDRHPVMARHPVTPMHEADVCRHLARQTGLPLAALTLDAMTDAAAARARLALLRAAGAACIAIDTVDARTQSVAGALIDGARVVVGSQGVESALIAHWRATGRTGPAPDLAAPGPAGPVAAVSGSVSAVTGAQIAAAEGAGFAAIAVDPARVLTEPDRAVEAAVRAALDSLSEGRDLILATARGPADPALARMAEAAARQGLAKPEAEAALGRALGRILDRVVREARLRRVVVAGGDTSGRVLGETPILALTLAAPISAGASLMRAHAEDPAFDGLTLVLKGGQMGPPDLFARAAGRAPATRHSNEAGSSRPARARAEPAHHNAKGVTS